MKPVKLDVQNRTFKRAGPAAALAGTLTGAVATAATAAPSFLPQVPGSDLIDVDGLPNGVLIETEGAEFTVDGETYETGPLEGRLNLFTSADTEQLSVSMTLSSKFGEEGVLGQVRIETTAATSEETFGLLSAGQQMQTEQAPASMHEDAAGSTWVTERPTKYELAIPPESRASDDLVAFPPPGSTLTQADPVALADADGEKAASGYLLAPISVAKE